MSLRSVAEHVLNLRSIMLVAAISVIVSGCSTIANKRTEKVNDGYLEYAVQGTRTPVVVFDSAIGADIDTWKKVFPKVAEFTTAFAYNRPGYGRSSGLGGVRAGKETVEDLHKLLIQTGHRPPYVLVGHSFGGLYTNLYARTYPQDVGAVVFVDSAHPDQKEWWSSNRPIYSSIISAISAIDILDPSSQESFAMDKVVADLRRAGPFPDVPGSY